jgi:hypothetical protein
MIYRLGAFYSRQRIGSTGRSPHATPQSDGLRTANRLENWPPQQQSAAAAEASKKRALKKIC